MPHEGAHGQEGDRCVKLLRRSLIRVELQPSGVHTWDSYSSVSKASFPSKMGC